MAYAITIDSISLFDGNENISGLPANCFVFAQSVVTLTVAVTYSCDAESRLDFSVNLNAGTVEAPGNAIQSRFIQFIVPATASTTVTKTFEISSRYPARMVDGDCMLSVQASVQEWYGARYALTRLTAGGYEIYSYPHAPEVTSLNVRRCNSDGTANVAGTHALVDLSYNIASLGSNNAKSLLVRWREQGAEIWTGSETIDISALDYSGALSEHVLDGTFDAGKKHDIQADLSDAIATTTNIKTLQSAGAVLHLSGDKRHIAFHKRCEPGEDAPGIDFGGELPGHFRAAPTYADRSAARAALGVPTICSGTIPSISLAADALTTVDVSFPVGLFSSVPDVNATIKYGMGYSASNLVLVAIDPTETTATKARFRLMRRGGATTVALSWVAVQMPS